jgi:hypothetical protein
MSNQVLAAPDARPPIPGRWQPGQSGNPAGRPRGRSFSEAVRRAVEPEELVLHLLAIVRGQGVRMTVAAGADGQPVFVEGQAPTFRDRVAAAKVLVERGWPRGPTDAAGAAAPPGPDLAAMTPEQLTAYAQVCQLLVSGALDPQRVLAAARGAALGRGGTR